MRVESHVAVLIPTRAKKGGGVVFDVCKLENRAAFNGDLPQFVLIPNGLSRASSGIIYFFDRDGKALTTSFR